MAFVARSCSSFWLLFLSFLLLGCPGLSIYIHTDIHTYTYTFAAATLLFSCCFAFILVFFCLWSIIRQCLRCVINLLILLIYVRTYNFFHSCLSFCVMRFSLLPFFYFCTRFTLFLHVTLRVLIKNSRKSISVILKHSQALKFHMI